MTGTSSGAAVDSVNLLLGNTMPAHAALYALYELSHQDPSLAEAISGEHSDLDGRIAPEGIVI